ncbi:MAG: glycosyltransferase [Elusimicrobia bacterium]|nr:glycosyltransferase [Elusimicrobiota bacterium]
MKISFIVTSLDKEKELQSCILSIEEAHRYRNDVEIEILAIVQNTQKKKAIKTGYPELSTFYYIPQTGLSAARNFAIKKSKGSFLVFLDDDAAVKEDFIDVLIKNTSKADAFCGRILDPVNKQAFSRYFLNIEKKYLKRFDFRYFMGSSHVLKRSILEEIGSYDENFGAGSKFYGAEESDIFFRLLKQSKRVLYIPDLVFYHPVPHKMSASKSFDYAYAVGAMLTKQITTDARHFFTYVFLIAEIIFKSLVRTIQSLFFWSSIRIKNEQFQYRSVFSGTIGGVIGYLRGRTEGKI